MKRFEKIFVLAACIFFSLTAGGRTASAQALNRAAKTWTQTLVEKASAGRPKIPAEARRNPEGYARQIVEKQKEVFASPELLNTSLDKSFSKLKLDRAVYQSFAKANDRRIAASKKLMRRQIAWYAKHREAIVSQLQVQPAVKHVDYERLIDPSAKVIYLGEMHYFPSIRREVLSAVMQYRRAHPKKKIYLLTEFMEAEYPNESSSGFYRNVYLRGKFVVPEHMLLLHRLAASGVLVRGLEPMRGLAELAGAFGVNDPTFGAGGISLTGQGVRNRSWMHTIRHYIQKDPDAVFFVYTGWSHSSYRYLGNLPTLVREPKSQVIIFSLWWEDTLMPSFSDLFRPDFLRDPQSKAVAVLKDPKYRRLLGADVLVHLHK